VAVERFDHVGMEHPRATVNFIAIIVRRSGAMSLKPC